MAQVLIGLGIKRAMIVYGNDRLDEISVSDSTSADGVALAAEQIDSGKALEKLNEFVAFTNRQD